MPWGTIEVKAYCVLVHPDTERFLVVHYNYGDYQFHRIPGGHLEFHELASQAMTRELAEELGLEVTDPVPIGVLENVFTDERDPGHEIVFCFARRLAEANFGDDGGEFEDEGVVYRASWRRFDAETPDLYPNGLDQILGNALSWTQP